MTTDRGRVGSCTVHRLRWLIRRDNYLTITLQLIPIRMVIVGSNSSNPAKCCDSGDGGLSDQLSLELSDTRPLRWSSPLRSGKYFSIGGNIARMAEFYISQGYIKLSQDRSVGLVKKENLSTAVSTETTATDPMEASTPAASESWSDGHS